MHVFIAGGTGFLGRQVVREFFNAGHRVSLLIHRTLSEPLPHTCHTYHGNITNFRWSELEADLPDVIIHLARIPGRFLPGRLTGGLQGRAANHRLITWMRQLERPPLLLFTSGTLVYGSQESLPIDEQSPMQPISFQKYYALAEYPVLKALSSSLPTRIIRPPWVFGRGSWFYQFYKKPMQQEGFVPVYGSGSQYMSLISLEEFGQLVRLIAETSTGNDIFNTVSNMPVRQHQFAGLLSEISGLPCQTITTDQLHRKYGKTVAEALTHSLFVQTKHSRLYQIEPEPLEKLKRQLETVLQPSRDYKRLER